MDENEVIKPYGDVEFKIRSYAPPEPVSALYVQDNTLKFSGEMDVAAQELFEKYLQPMCDHYIRERLKSIAGGG